MRIAFVVYLFPKLSETFILNQITGLMDRGHDVEIIAQINPCESKVHSDVERYRLMKKVHYINMSQNKIERILKVPYLLAANLHKNPVKILKSLNVLEYGIDALSLRLFYTCVFSLNFQEKFDVIHCHHGPNGIVGIYLKSNGVGSRVVTHFHGYDISGYILKRGIGVYKRLFMEGDAFLAVSDSIKKKLVESGCKEEKILVHHMGIDLNKIKYSERKIQSKEYVKILTVGRLTEKKGHEYALKAIADVIKTHKDISYIIAGDGPLKGKLESLASSLGITGNVEFFGAIDQDELLKLYEQAHIFILPSVTARDGDQEGAPVVLMEAQASGIPVISTLHSGIPEVVVDGKSGFLVPEKDADALADKINYLIEHPEIWPELGRAGRTTVEEKYDINKLNDRLIEVYAQLVSCR